MEQQLEATRQQVETNRELIDLMRTQAVQSGPQVSIQPSEPERPALPHPDASTGLPERVSPNGVSSSAAANDTGFDTPDDTPALQLEIARTWLARYPDKQGLSLRKAAEKAGVSLATLQRAIKSGGKA